MSPQQTIGHYRITSKIGEGGMGAVYRATDTKLGREVAIKVLPDALANDPDYVARFSREAQVLAALNHPHIAAVYGIEERAIVMELVEGRELPTPVPVDEAIAIARQIAEALEAAHDKGIVHRDLKPANIKLTADGSVKVLDFGLAKAPEAGAQTSNANSPTLTLRATQAGIIMGTAGYMAPEQAAGKPVDKRADIWSFGVVFYELLTGRQLFSGESVAHILADVLRAEIDFSQLPAETPPAIRDLLIRCLDRDARTRLRDIGEARVMLSRPLAAGSAVSKPRRQLAGWVAAAVLAVAGVAGWYRSAQPHEERLPIRFNAEISSMALMNSRSGSSLAISPDGRRMAVCLTDKDQRTRLYTRLMNESDLTVLPGAEAAHSPFFSPDGAWIGFGAAGKLKKVSVNGGAVITLCDSASLRGASWGDDGYIVFAANINVPLSRVSAEGGAPAMLTKLNTDRTHRWPEVLPGSQAVLFTNHVGANNYNDAAIEAVALRTGERKVLVRGGFSPHYATLPDGSSRLFFARENTVFAVPLWARRFRLATVGRRKRLPHTPERAMRSGSAAKLSGKYTAPIPHTIR